MPDSQKRDGAPPQRILMTADAVGGVWTYALDLAEQLSRLNIATLLATMGPRPTDAQRLQAASVRNLELVESSFPLEWMPGVSDTAIAETGAWLNSLAARFGTDVIHLNGYAYAACQWNAPVVVVAHSCVCSWWLAVHGEPAPAEWDGYRRRVLAGLEAADAVIAPSRWMLNTLGDIYSPRLKHLAVIHNFTSLEISYGEKQPVILAAGRLWDRAKNLALLDQIAPSTEWQLQVAGDAEGPDGSRYRPEHIRVLGHLSREGMARRLSEAAIFAHPAQYEPFGLSILEAAKAGCALVLSDIPSLRELWDGSALYAPPGDARCWENCIGLLAQSASLRQEYAARALLRSHAFDTNSAVRSYLKLYTSLANARKAPALARCSLAAQ